MMKKYYILALTFFCLLCSQLSFGQPLSEAGYEEINHWYNDDGHYFRIFENSEGNFIITESWVSNGVNFMNHYAHDIYPEIDWNPLIPTPTDPESGTDPCPSGDYNDCYGNGGGGGSAPPPAPTEPPCTINCESGYKLNLDNCECEALDPCLINKDLRHKKVSDYVKNLIDLRVKTVFMNGSYVNVKEFEIQEIEDGKGDINLDKYSLDILKLPNGYTPQMLFNEIRRNLDDFVTGGNLPGFSVKLEAYSRADGNKWASSNPIGAAMDFDNLMDTSTVICTEYNYDEMYWTFTTVHSLDHQGHFVSGHRQFGIEANSDGSFSFYLRGADRLGQFIDYAANNYNPVGDDFLFNKAADATWKNFMSNLEKFIKSKTGAAVKTFDKYKDYTHRFPYNENDCPE